jgi:hypothetical protein
MAIDAALQRLDERLCAWAEARAVSPVLPADRILEDLGFIRHGELVPLAETYYINRWVREDEAATKETLAQILRELLVVNTFCGLAGSDRLPIAGAIRLLKRITKSDDESSARRWLELMNRGGLVVYNRASPVVRILYRSNELVDAGADAARERKRGHLLSPQTQFGNLLALKELIRSARGSIRWYEQHMPPKVLEVLYRELKTSDVRHVYLLSGPANLTSDTKDELKRFVDEMAKNNVAAEWRVLSKGDAFQRHDRFFITEGIARNLPPLNTILAGSVGEILPSDVRAKEFDAWWDEAKDLLSMTLPMTGLRIGSRP